MSVRPLAGAAILTLLSVAPLTAQNEPPPGSILRPDAVTVSLLRPSFRGEDAPDAGARTGFAVGVRSRRRLNRRTRLETGIGLASRGARESSGSFSATTTTMNVEVPVVGRFRINEANAPTPAPRFFFSAVGGVMGDFNVSCSTTFESSGSSSSSDCTDNAAMDIAAVLGGGAHFTIAGRNAGVDLLFTNGFMPVFKDFKVFNRSLGIQFTMGWTPIPSASFGPIF